MTYQFKYIFQENLICTIIIHFPEFFKRFWVLGSIAQSLVHWIVCLEFFWDSKYCRKKVPLCLLLEEHCFPVFQIQIHSVCLSPVSILVFHLRHLVHYGLILLCPLQWKFSACISLLQLYTLKFYLDICRRHYSYKQHNQFCSFYLECSN